MLEEYEPFVVHILWNMVQPKLLPFGVVEHQGELEMLALARGWRNFPRLARRGVIPWPSASGPRPQASQGQGELGIHAGLFLDERQDALALPGGVQIEAVAHEHLEQRRGDEPRVQLVVSAAIREQQDPRGRDALVVREVQVGSGADEPLEYGGGPPFQFRA